MNIFFSRRDRPCADVFVSLFACVRRAAASECTALNQRTRPFSTSVTNVVHRFEQSIAGRPYLIEVANVSQDRWRAYIVRIPGVPTALMPFYGRTPVEAAGLLTEWLSRAYQRAASTAPG